ncbi:hypothetical protein O988_03447, partial [Pseudogymnoascus sp. VKM F-3808]
MSDLPEHLRDQYGSQPQDDDTQYHSQQSFCTTVAATIPDASPKRTYIIPAATAVHAPPWTTVAEPATKHTVSAAVPATAVPGDVPPGPRGAHSTRPGWSANKPAAVSGTGLCPAPTAAGHPATAAATDPTVLLSAGST